MIAKRRLVCLGNLRVVLALGALLSCNGLAQSAHGQSCCPHDGAESFDLRRIESARVLTDEARRLEKMTSLLNRWSALLSLEHSNLLALKKETPLVDTMKGSIEETHARTKESAENFQKLFQNYQDARRQYLQHKLLYDEHVATFHNQAQQQNVQMIEPQSQNTSAVLVAPQVTRLRVKAQDACNNLQQEEFALSNAEAHLAATVNYLASIKGKSPSDVYFQVWTTAQTSGSSLQRQVVDFGRDVLSKQQTSVEQLHDLTQAAQTNGDFVQSRDLYMEVQRSAALNNEETKRAHMHTMFAAAALGTINSLSPLNTAPPSPPSNSGGPLVQNYQVITNDEIQRESKALEREYDNLQSQYAEMERANPGNNKR